LLPPEVQQAAASGTKNTYALAALRIAVGALFLIFGQYKVFGTQFTLHGGFQFWINGFLEQGAYPFMTGILRGFVLPHATAIAFIVAYGEFAIGLALTLGVLVRPASFAGLIYMLALLCSSNYPTPSNYPVSSDFPSSGVVFWRTSAPVSTTRSSPFVLPYSWWVARTPSGFFACHTSRNHDASSLSD
jgi:uncharacterized membrane protein YphA (DoxX/SURF4 family)